MNKYNDGHNDGIDKVDTRLSLLSFDVEAYKNDLAGGLNDLCFLVLPYLETYSSLSPEEKYPLFNNASVFDELQDINDINKTEKWLNRIIPELEGFLNADIPFDEKIHINDGISSAKTELKYLKLLKEHLQKEVKQFDKSKVLER